MVVQLNSNRTGSIMWHIDPGSEKLLIIDPDLASEVGDHIAHFNGSPRKEGRPTY